MGGMGGSAANGSPFVVSQFHHYLAVGLLWVLIVAVVATFATSWWRQRRPFPIAEMSGRTWLRFSFGALWIFDGILQLQAGMPLGLANQVFAPAADGNPSVVKSIIATAVRLWNEHPLAFAPATVWMQIGIGLLLWSSRGTASRVGGALSVFWGSLVWAGGNGFGGMLGAHSSFLFGWPGAVFFYMVAGFFLARPPERCARHLSLWSTRVGAVTLAVGSLWQILPQNDFWASGSSNALWAMSNDMTGAAQPGFLRSLVRAVGRMGYHGGAIVNAVIVLWMLATAIGLWRYRKSTARWPFISASIGAVTIWITIQDLGIFGGVGTDPNSMLPFAALILAGASWKPLERLSLSARWSHVGASVAAFGVAMTLVGGVPVASASLFSPVETTQYEALNASVSILSPRIAAPELPVALVNQFGQTRAIVRHGHVTVVTFLDPRCWTDCAALGRQLVSLDKRLGSPTSVTYVAIAANRFHHSIADDRAFIHRYGLTELGSRFQFLTGTRAQLETAWSAYGIEVDMKPTDKMSVHTDQVDVIDAQGRVAVIVPDDPPSGWSGQESAVTVLAGAVRLAQR